MYADRCTAYLIIPELSYFLVLHGGVVPDEVGGFIFVPGLNEVHFIDGYANWGLKWVSYLISYATNSNIFNDIMTHIKYISPLHISDSVAPFFLIFFFVEQPMLIIFFKKIELHVMHCRIPGNSERCRILNSLNGKFLSQIKEVSII